MSAFKIKSLILGVILLGLSLFFTVWLTVRQDSKVIRGQEDTDVLAIKKAEGSCDTQNNCLKKALVLSDIQNNVDITTEQNYDQIRRFLALSQIPDWELKIKSTDFVRNNDWTLLDFAVATDNTDLASLLLEQGAYPGVRRNNFDCEYNSPLIKAIYKKNHKIVDLLLQKGANELEYENVLIPLFAAVMNDGNIHLIQKLYKRSVRYYDKEKTRFDKGPILNYEGVMEVAISRGNLPVVKFLYEQGIPINLDYDNDDGVFNDMFDYYMNKELIAYLIKIEKLDTKFIVEKLYSKLNYLCYLYSVGDCTEEAVHEYFVKCIDTITYINQQYPNSFKFLDNQKDKDIKSLIIIDFLRDCDKRTDDISKFPAFMTKQLKNN